MIKSSYFQVMLLVLYQSLHINSSFMTQANNIPKNPVYQEKVSPQLQLSANQVINSLQCT